MQLISHGKGWIQASNNHLFWTNDNGSHWSDITPKAAGFMSDIFFLDGSHGWVLLSTAKKESGLVSYQIAHTSDSGKTWTVSAMRVPSQKPDELDGYAWLDFVDPTHGWAVLRAKSSSAFSWGLLLSTKDGGETWNELPQAPIAGRPVFATPQDGWISGNGGPKGMYSTHDGGKSWQRDGPSLTKLPPTLPTTPAYGDAKFTDAKHGTVVIYLSPSGDAEESKGTAMVSYTTSDGGTTWGLDHVLTDSGAMTKTGAAMSRLLAGCIVPASAGPSTLIAAFREDKDKGRVTLLSTPADRSTTGAATQAITESVIRREGDDIVRLSFENRSSGWAMTRAGVLLRTTDGGKSWRDISPPEQPTDATKKS